VGEESNPQEMAKAKTLEQVYCKDRPAWRLWLSKNHDKVSDGI